jgi:hypothetical protein
MEGEIIQRWKEGFNNDGRRDSTTMEGGFPTTMVGGIKQRWKEGFNNDGRRIQQRRKDGFSYDGRRDSTMMGGGIQQRWKKRRFAQRNAGEDG